MSKPLKKIHNVARKGLGWGSFGRNAMNALGISQSSTIRQLVDPAGGLMGDVNRGEFSVDKLKGGDYTDPAGMFHSRGTPEAVEPIPAPQSGAVEGNKARDRMRRRAYRAQGRASTIRSAPGSTLGSPGGLLGS